MCIRDRLSCARATSSREEFSFISCAWVVIGSYIPHPSDNCRETPSRERRWSPSCTWRRGCRCAVIPSPFWGSSALDLLGRLSEGPDRLDDTVGERRDPVSYTHL